MYAKNFIDSDVSKLPDSIRTLAQHWSFHRSGKKPPHINALSAVDLFPWWSHLVFANAGQSLTRWEVLAAGGFAMEMFGRSFVGSDFLDIDGTGTRTLTLQRLTQAIELGAPVVYVGERLNERRVPVPTRRVLLPLRSEMDEIRHVMVGVFAH